MKRKRRKTKRAAVCVSVIAAALAVVFGVKIFQEMTKEKPEDLIVAYMAHIEKQE